MSWWVWKLSNDRIDLCWCVLLMSNSVWQFVPYDSGWMLYVGSGRR